MVPRQFPGKDRAIKQLRFSTEILFRVLEQHEPDHPLLAEAYRQAITLFLDLAGACAWMEKTAGTRLALGIARNAARESVRVQPVRLPTKGKLMFEDPDEAIERLYQQFYAAGESTG